MINIDATIRWKGYNPDNLSMNSNKRVWANCEICGNERWVYFYVYRDLCRSCVKIGKNNHMFGKQVSKEIRERIRCKNTNKIHSKESRIKMSKAQFGKKLSEETKQKMRKCKLGEKKKNPRWNGGNKLRNARSQAKRKQFGFNPINSSQENFEGHHLNLNDVLFIPKELHKSIAHSVTHNKNMNIINNLAEEWYLWDQGVI